MRRALPVLLGLAVAGCARANMVAFRDPAFLNVRFDKVAIAALNMDLGAAAEVEHQVCHKIAPTPCVEGHAVLPPTRTYTADAIKDAFDRAGVDGVLLVELVADQSSTDYAGTFTTGSVNLYGTPAAWTTTAQSISLPIYRDQRVAVAEVEFFESSTGNMAWRGELRVSGNGGYAVTDKAFIRSASSKIASELRAAGLVR